MILATGVTPRDPGIPTDPGATVLSYIDVLRGAPVGPRVAIIGAGGIGFDVAEFLVHQGDSPTEHPDLWRREWGVSTPWARARRAWPTRSPNHPPGRSGCCSASPASRGAGWARPPAGSTAPPWRPRMCKMIGGVNYERITPQGLQISHGPDRLGAESVAVDAVILCAGQEPARGLAEGLTSAGIPHHLIGGADVAAELDAKRAIDQAVRLAARL